MVGLALGSADVIRGDARSLPLPDASVDLIITSPPYFALRSYQDGGEHYDGQIGSEETPGEFVDALLQVTRECMRVLKPAGSLWVNLGDKYAQDSKWGGASGVRSHASAHRVRRTSGIRDKSLMGLPWRYALRCIDELGLILRAEVIWDKPNGLPESVTDRVRRAHEQWFHFTKEPRYFAAVDRIREEQIYAGLGRRNGAGAIPRDPGGRPAGDGSQHLDGNPLGKLPGSVRTVPSEPLTVPAELGVDHFAAFPTAWPRWICEGWLPTGVCTACGEGRRPSVVKEFTETRGHGDPKRRWATLEDDGRRTTGMGAGRNGFNTVQLGPDVCGCNEPIGSPLGRAGEADPSIETGRAGFNRPRSEDSGVRVVTRWEQRHEAGQLRAAPFAIRAVMEQEAGSAFSHYIRTDRTGARPVPQPLRELWLERGWLQPVPEFVPPPTTPAVVLDPFGGTGTVALVAKALGAHGISVDMSADYCRLASWRVNDRDQLGKVLGIARPPAPVPADHPALF